MLRTIVYGTSHFTVNERDEADVSVCAEIFVHEEYRRARETIQNAQYPVIDVGAHAGFFILYVRSLNPEVPIVALEPETLNCQQLLLHLKLNTLSRVTVVPAALGATTGSTDLYIASDHHNHSLKSGYGVSNAVRRVKLYSFQDVRSLYGVDRVSLIKMDIEGGEYDALLSFSAADFASVEAIIMEYHNFARYHYTIIEQKLRENGFSVEVFPSRFDKTMGFLWARNKRLARAV